MGDGDDHSLSSVLPKLAFLADLREEHACAFLGSGGRAWRDDLAVSPGELRTSLDGFGECDARLGLVIIAPGDRDGAVFVGAAVRQAARRVRPGGTVMLVADNGLALASRLRRRAWRSAGTVFSFRRLLREAGFEFDEFLAVPNIRAPEEFVRGAGREVAVGRTGRLRLARALAGSGGWLHDGHLYLAARQGVGYNAVVPDIAAGTGRAAFDVLRIGRFDLRHRGLLVLLLEHASGAPGAVCRVAATPAAAALLDYGNQWLRRLGERPDVPPALSAAIPRVMASGTVRGRPVSVETRLPGIISWKVRTVPAVERRAFGELRRFLEGLHAATARRRVVDRELFARLMAPLPPSVAPAVTTSMERDLASLLAALEARMRGQEHALVWAHGDFGYGNALVDPVSGALTGIIDWDTAREVELAGVDLVNFLLQRHRMARRVPLSDALAEIGAQVLCDGIGPVPPGAAREVLVVAFLRFFQRSARYPRVFATERSGLLRAARWCEGVLAADGPQRGNDAT